MTNRQRQFFIETIKKQFNVDIQFYPKHPKGYGLLFPTDIEDTLKENVIKFYEAILKN
jgi:hypothetical protein